jgi:hypothetical protein
MKEATTILLSMMLLSALRAAPLSASETYTKEQLAGGAMREIISAEAYHRKAFPQLGYACSIERLVAVQALGEVWSTGKRVEGYVFKVWCDHAGTPQTTYRASAVPVNKTSGSTLTLCADETKALRTIDGDVKACLERGTAPPQ